MANKVFKTKSGKETDIMHSYGYYKSPYRARREMAFNKTFLNSLSERDKNLMRGYAQAKIEEMQAFRFNNPDYQRRGSGKRMSASEITKFFK